jgi:hypothetical protein
MRPLLTRWGRSGSRAGLRGGSAADHRSIALRAFAVIGRWQAQKPDRQIPASWRRCEQQRVKTAAPASSVSGGWPVS